MDHDRAVRISRLMSFGLRHDPAALGLSLDHAGWAPVEALLSALASRGETVSAEELLLIVRTSDKKRFALSEDGLRIRANQGHSVNVDLGLVPRDPPPLLYHGTVARFLPSIREAGLLPGSPKTAGTASSQFGTASTSEDGLSMLPNSKRQGTMLCMAPSPDVGSRRSSSCRSRSASPL